MKKYILPFIAGIACAIVGAFLYISLAAPNYLRHQGADGHFSRIDDNTCIGIVLARNSNQLFANCLVVLHFKENELVTKSIRLPLSWSNEILVTRDKASQVIRIGDIPSNSSYELDIAGMKLVGAPGMALIRDQDEILLLLKN